MCTTVHAYMLILLINKIVNTFALVLQSQPHSYGHSLFIDDLYLVASFPNATICLRKPVSPHLHAVPSSGTTFRWCRVQRL